MRQVFLQGQMDSDLQLMARCHVAFNPQNVTKLMTQVVPNSSSLYVGGRGY